VAILIDLLPARSALGRRLAVLALLMLFLVGGIASAMAQTELQAPEYRVKAAFVYKFGDYIEWPADAFADSSSPLVIGVVGADALADELARIANGRTVGGRPVAVKKLKYGEPLSGLQVIFIGSSNSEQLAAVLDASKGRPALTITESEDGLRLGSAINFVVVSDKVRFDVALPSAETNRLKISSRLLAVARKVVPSPP
jgi:hypothetical protein